MKPPDLIRTIEIKDKSGRVVGTKEVVTYPGLLSKAHEEGLVRIATELLQKPSEENGRTAIAKALVETAKGHFEAIGDAAPDSVNSFIVPHLIRMAETRAKARALRDAVNIGIVSFEELDGDGLLPNGSDLGSGAATSKGQVIPMGRSGSAAAGQTQVREPAPAENESSPAAVSAAPASSGNGAKALMSEAQRRYLFRLLAARKIQGEAAHEYLKEKFQVVALKNVTKAQASNLIEELLKPQTVPGDDDIPF